MRGCCGCASPWTISARRIRAHDRRRHAVTPMAGGGGAAREAEPFLSGDVRGFLHRPERADAGGLVLTHGAGGSCTAPLLVAVAAAFCAAGFAVLRCDLPFRQRRPTGPPSPPG